MPAPGCGDQADACRVFIPMRGAIAQLGERVNGIHEVVGSIPTGSTKSFNKLEIFVQASESEKATT